jgi:hypothetical protein
MYDCTPFFTIYSFVFSSLAQNTGQLSGSVQMCDGLTQVGKDGIPIKFSTSDREIPKVI